jgi:hypothetical protein
MTISSDPGASAGRCISPASGSSSTSPQEEAALGFSVPSQGTYHLWLRMMGPDSQSDALYAGIDSSWDRVFPAATGAYEWVRVETSSGSGAYAFSLPAGSHTLRLGHGEINSRADRLFLTGDPAGTPSDAAPLHRSDSNSDGCVSMAELSAFLDLWRSDSSNPTIRELMEAIGLWKVGC